MRRLVHVLCRSLLTLTLVSQGCIAPANAGSKRTWNFESNEPGKIARGFTSEVGNWEIVIEGGNNVLAQKARNDDDTYNVLLVDGSDYKDVDLSVRMRAVAGELDQGVASFGVRRTRTITTSPVTTRLKITSVSTRWRPASARNSLRPEFLATRSGTP